MSSFFCQLILAILCGVASYRHLHNVKRIRKYLSRESTEMLVHAFITSRVDYCNSLLYGLPNYQLNKLQRVLNASARLVCNAPRFCHISPLLRGLHWLPVKARIEFKILLITFKAIHGLAPKYLCDLLTFKSSLYNLRSSGSIFTFYASCSIEDHVRWQSFYGSSANTLELSSKRTSCDYWCEQF